VDASHQVSWHMHIVHPDGVAKADMDAEGGSVLHAFLNLTVWVDHTCFSDEDRVLSDVQVVKQAA